MLMNRLVPMAVILSDFLASSASAAPITTGLQLFLDANRSSSFTLSGSDVSAWADQSTAGNNAVQASATEQPELVPGAVGGLPAVRFDGVQNGPAGPDGSASAEFLDTGLGAYTGGSAFTAVVAVGTVGGGNQQPLLGTDSGVTFGTTVGRVNGAFRIQNDADANIVEGGGFNLGSNQIRLLTRDAADNINEFLSGTNATTGSSLGGTFNLSIIGARRANSANLYLDSDIAEILAYNRELNDAERIITQNYLSSKYTMTLGADDFYGGEGLGAQHDVFGVGNDQSSGFEPGSVTTGTSGGVTISATGLDDGDFILAGFELDNDSTQSTIYLDETATDGNETVTLSFDLATLGLAGNFGLGYNASDPNSLGLLPLTGNQVGSDLSFVLGGSLQDGFFGLVQTAPPLAPEPSTIALMSLALGLMATWYYRRRVPAAV